MKPKTLVFAVAAAAAVAGIAVVESVHVASAPAADAAARGTLAGASFRSGTGMVFRVTGENLANARWTRTPVTDQRGNVTGETGSAVVGRRTYSYTATFQSSARTARGVSGRITVGGGILRPARQTVRF